MRRLTFPEIEVPAGGGFARVVGPMLSVYDHAVIGVYFALLIVIGAAFRRRNRTTSDFFRGGGKMLWWIVGSTAFMTQFSAWTFTGAASKAYETGALVLAIYFGSALGFFCNYLGTAARLRQLRVITMFEAVRQRWSRGNEQFFTWLQLPVGTLLAGIALNGLGVILAAVFGLDPRVTMLGAGLVVIFMATCGGSWAATAGDFMQMLTLMAVTAAAAALALREVGGVTGFVARLPEESLAWGNTGRPEIVAWWFVALALTQVLATNNMSDGYRYLGAKDTAHARRGALLASVLFIVGPIVWFVPPMVGRMLFPDLGAVPALQPLGSRASEGIYLAVGIATMPQGMLGLMITSLFAATISNMDTGLNKNAGIFVRSFYKPVLRPQADERELMRASRVATLGFGVLTVLAAFAFRAMSHLSLFNLMQQFVSLVLLPVAVPLAWGLFVRRTPPWSGWSTVVVCLAASLVIGNLDTLFGAGAYGRMMGFATPLERWEQPTAVFSLGVVTNVVVGSVWFLATSWWYRRQPAEYRATVEAFFAQLRRPVDFAREEGGATDRAQLRLMGRLGVAYGGFVAVLMLIPNEPFGRAAFGFVGLTIGGIGALLLRAAKKAPADEAEPRTASVEREELARN